MELLGPLEQVDTGVRGGGGTLVQQEPTGSHLELERVGLVLRQAGSGVHSEVRHSLYCPFPTGKVSVSGLGYQGLGEG